MAQFKEFWNKPPEAKSLHAKYAFNRTFSIKPQEQTASLTTLDGRLKGIKYTCWNKHQELLSQGEIGDATLWYDKSSKAFYLLVLLTIKVQEQMPKQIVNVDVGERNLLAVANTTGEKYLVPTLESWRRTEDRYHR